MPRAANSSGNCSIFCSTLRRRLARKQAVEEVQPAVYALSERRDIKRRGDGNSTAHNVDSRIALFAKPLEQYVAAERDTHRVDDGMPSCEASQYPVRLLAIAGVIGTGLQV